MANNEDERILSIKVKYQDAINGILEYQNKLQALKKEQEKWKMRLLMGRKTLMNIMLLWQTLRFKWQKLKTEYEY